MRKTTILAALSAAALAFPHGAQAQQQALVTCESRGSGQQMCAAGTVAGARINRQLSNTTCVRGSNWGFTSRAIWVSGGCRAEFLVTQGSTGYGSGRYNTDKGRYRNNGRYDDNGRYDNTTVSNYYTELNAGRITPQRLVSACRRLVRAQLGETQVEASMANNSRMNPRVGFTTSSGRTGVCRIGDDGQMLVQLSNRRANRWN